MDTTKYQQKLEAEKRRLESELGELTEAGGGEAAFRDEIADRLEEQEENEAGEEELKQELREIKNALAKIEEGTYGYCAICKQPIEEERLEANPAAATCITHREG